MQLRQYAATSAAELATLAEAPCHSIGSKHAAVLLLVCYTLRIWVAGWLMVVVHARLCQQVNALRAFGRPTRAQASCTTTRA